MTFDEYVHLNKEYYFNFYGRYLGIMIENWMYCDWMAVTFPDEWRKKCEEIKCDELEREVWYNGN